MRATVIISFQRNLRTYIAFWYPIMDFVLVIPIFVSIVMLRDSLKPLLVSMMLVSHVIC